MSNETAIPSYVAPEMYDGRLPDGRLALIIVMSNDSLHVIKVGPMRFPDSPTDIADFEDVSIMGSPRRIHYLGSHKRTAPITDIVPNGAADDIRIGTPGELMAVDRAAESARQCRAPCRPIPDRILRAIRPHVSRAAVLAREAEGLRAEVATMRKQLAAEEAQRDGALRSSRDANEELHAAHLKLDAARVEIERLRALVCAGHDGDATEHLRAAREALAASQGESICGAARRARGTADSLRAEIERLKAISDAWKALAKARRDQYQAARVGARESEQEAIERGADALDTLRVLGIDPDR